MSVHAGSRRTTSRRQRASGSSFYTAMRILPRAQREAMFEIYSFCRRSTTSPTPTGRATPRRGQLAALARRHRRALCRARRRRARRPRASRCATSTSQREDFLAVIDGMEMDVVDDIRAPDCGHARPLLRPRGERGRAAVGARVRHGARGRHRARASSRPRAAAHQHPARPRRGRRDRPALSAARGAARRRHHQHRSADGAGATRRSAQACDAVVARAREHFAEADAIMARIAAPHACARRASWATVYRAMLDRLVARGWSRAAQAGARFKRACV